MQATLLSVSHLIHFVPTSNGPTHRKEFEGLRLKLTLNRYRFQSSTSPVAAYIAVPDIGKFDHKSS